MTRTLPKNAVNGVVQQGCVGCGGWVPVDDSLQEMPLQCQGPVSLALFNGVVGAVGG